MPLQESVTLADKVGAAQKHTRSSLGFRTASDQYRPAIDGLRAVAVLAVFCLPSQARLAAGRVRRR